MYANGSGIADFDPWKGLALFIIMMIGALNVLTSQSYDLTLSFDPDCWGNETSWEFRDSGGNVIDDISTGDYSTGFSNGPGTYTHTFTVTDGSCYEYEVFDSWWDGMTGSIYGSCNVDGDFEITDASGNIVLELDDPDFGASVEFTFCITAGCADPSASNYNSSANVDDGSCIMAPPTAGFTSSQTGSGCGTATIAFTNTSTSASSYSWAFENGTPATSTAASPTVTFPTGGTHTAVLTATSSAGSDTANEEVTVALDEIGELVTFVLSPDCYASETSWDLRDANDVIIASAAEGDYDDEFPEYTTEERVEVCMTDQCYTFNIYDQWGDGMEGDTYWMCDQDGTYWFEDSAGNTILEFDDDPDFGYSNQETPCINYTFVWTGALDDDWQNPGNWEDNEVPSSQHTALISQTNNAPNMNETVTLERLIIDENSEINFANNSGKFKLESHFINEGIFDVSKGQVIMQGDEMQYIKGNTSTFYKLKINSTDTVTLLADMNLRGPLIPTKGVFDWTGREVVLVSEENYTGSIGEIKNNATLLGDTITVQRYFPAGPGSWRMICSPIEGATFEEWNDDIPTTGFTGADYPTYPSAANPWSNVRIYNETLVEGDDADIDAGFESISNITDVIDHTKGYFVYMVPSPTTIDVRGAFHQYDEEMTLTFSESNTDPFNDGWNLVANPYPSAIDWEDAAGWDTGDINNAIYAYDPVNGQYSSFVNGISIGSMDGTIASSQAFWVKSESGTPTVEINEKAKVNTTGVHMRSDDINTEAVIRLKLIAEGEWDEAVVGFHAQATTAFDGMLDAFKFYTPDEDLPNLASRMDTTDSGAMTDVLSINMMPTPQEELPIDLIVKKGAYQDFIIQNTMVDSYDDNLCIILHDHELGTAVEFNQGDWYMFTMSEESAEDRLSLSLSAPLNHEQIDESCPDMANGSIEVGGFGPAPWTYTWTDSDGNIIQETAGSSSNDMMSALEPGFYTVVVENTMEQCASATKVVEIMPAPEEWADAEVLTLTCINENEASLEVSLEDHYMWDIILNGSNGELVQQIAGFQGDTVLTDLPGDDFEVVVISQCGTQYELYDLDTRSPQSVIPHFTTEGETVNLAETSTATFLNNTINGVEFVWDYGDGTIDSTNIDGQHIYSQIGLYEVTLTASNSYCSDAFTSIVAVVWNEMDNETDAPDVVSLDPDKVTSADMVDLDTKMNITYGSQNIIVKSEIYVEEQVVFQIFNGAGQLVHTEAREELTASPIELQIGHLAQGVFYLNILSGDIVLKSEKFLKN